MYRTSKIAIFVALIFIFTTGTTFIGLGQEVEGKLPFKIEPKHDSTIKIKTFQDFILDAMALDEGNGTGTRTGFTTVLKSVISGSVTLEEAAKVIHNDYLTEMKEKEIKTAISDLLELTNMDIASTIKIINQGFPDIGDTLSIRDITKKINKDIAGDFKDDRGVKLLIRLLQTTYFYTGEVLITDGGKNPSKVEFNKLSDYTDFKLRMNGLLCKFSSLPVSAKTFDHLIKYYEEYINSLKPSQIKDFKSFVNGPNGDYGLYQPKVVVTPTCTPTPTNTPTPTKIKKSNNANIKSLSFNEGKLLPSFNKDRFKYLLKVDYFESDVTMKLKRENKKSSVYVNGKLITKDQFTINLRAGANKVVITVVAEDGKTTNKYIVNVYREWMFDFCGR